MTTNNSSDISRPTVAVVACSDYSTQNVESAVQKQFALLSKDIKISKGDKVLLKPNFIVPKPADQAAQTHPAVILAVAKVVKELGAKPFVGDSPAWGDISNCIQALELEEPLKKLEVPIRQLDKPVNKKIAGSNIGISSVALKADKIINLPKFKAHQQLAATFAIKNMFGCVAGKRKVYWHFAKGGSPDDFCSMLVGIYKLLDPVVTIIDGIVAMEGSGPINGTPKNLGVLIGSSDPVACERVCCELVKFNPNDLPVMTIAKRFGLGCGDLEQINIVGDDHRKLVCSDFVPSKQTPLRFTFFRICKSIIKQICILTKSAISRRNHLN
ncbi:MAG: DUF362 domain-containing protein [Sedimentisphaerales bacterium]|nr:DUF362 domain-containing protein [Sedimentisphaerales bacterium]